MTNGLYCCCIKSANKYNKERQGNNNNKISTLPQRKMDKEHKSQKRTIQMINLYRKTGLTFLACKNTQVEITTK